MRENLRPIFLTVPLAFGFWFFIFAVPAGNFWYKLTFSASTLAAIGLFCSRNALSALFTFKARHLLVGIGSALLLYGIFRVGREVSTMLLPFASGQIEGVYSNKVQLSTSMIGLLLFFVMGPAEEIYWHGFVQRILSVELGSLKGVLFTALIYTLIHAFSLNLMLILAAFVCGIFWGLLYLHEQSLIPLIISHSLWDVLIFVFFPVS